jgi:hypothetical protein
MPRNPLQSHFPLTLLHCSSLGGELTQEGPNARLFLSSKLSPADSATILFTFGNEQDLNPSLTVESGAAGLTLYSPLRG